MWHEALICNFLNSGDVSGNFTPQIMSNILRLSTFAFLNLSDIYYCDFVGSGRQEDAFYTFNSICLLVLIYHFPHMVWDEEEPHRTYHCRFVIVVK